MAQTSPRSRPSSAIVQSRPPAERTDPSSTTSTQSPVSRPPGSSKGQAEHGGIDSVASPRSRAETERPLGMSTRGDALERRNELSRASMSRFSRPFPKPNEPLSCQPHEAGRDRPEDLLKTYLEAPGAAVRRGAGRSR
jgi:hypothetical protein